MDINYKQKLLKSHLAMLLEHFDKVQIFAVYCDDKAVYNLAEIGGEFNLTDKNNSMYKN